MTKSKEEIIKNKLGNSYEYHDVRDWGNLIEDAMDEYAKQKAVGFFKWYGVKMMDFLFYLKKVKPQVTSNEIEEKLAEFEGQTIENLYQLYLQSKSHE